MKLKKLILSCVCIFTLHTAMSQVHLGGGVLVGVPNGEYAQYGGSVGVGFDANIFFPFAPKVPLFFGVDVGYVSLASNTQNEVLQADVKIGNTVIDVIQMPLEITTRNNLLQTHAVLRAKAPLPIVEPYIDGLVGFKYIYTRTKIIDQTDNFQFSEPDNNVINASTSQQDFVFSYGGGGGMMVNIGPNAKLDFRFVYLLSAEAEYYTKEDIDNITVEFTGLSEQDYQDKKDGGTLGGDDLDTLLGAPTKSRTDMFFITAGIVFSF